MALWRSTTGVLQSRALAHRTPRGAGNREHQQNTANFGGPQTSPQHGASTCARYAPKNIVHALYNTLYDPL
eukprot:11193303-Lingulodinium_polyedra.AAC.1